MAGIDPPARRASAGTGPAPSRRTPAWAALAMSVVLVGLAGLMAADPAVAAQPKEYAYLLVRGRLLGPSGTEPLAGARITLVGKPGSFEARTDATGAFLFDRLPVASYDVHVVNAAGEKVRRFRRTEAGVAEVHRFQIDFGRGEEGRAALAPAGDGIEVSTVAPKIRWGRFWRQFAIFAGCAVVLAL